MDSTALDLLALIPNSKTGSFAVRIVCIAWATASKLAAPILGVFKTDRVEAGVSLSITSCGKLTKDAPEGEETASRKASVITSGTFAAFSTSTLNLAIALNSPSLSID
ncbi:Uncharacterised protein [Streptococcus pneumoniae]|nr:Uncharacterised protein [Streptococcus pneumoniae]